MPEEPRPKRRWLRRLRQLVVALLIFVVLLALGLNLTLRIIGGRDYAAAVADIETDDPLWRWDELNARRPPIPDRENAALKLYELARLIPQPKKTDTPVDIAEVPPNVRLTPQQRAEREAQLHAAATSVDAVRGLRKLPHSAWPIARVNDPTDTQSPRRVTAWLRDNVFVNLERDRPTEALDAAELHFDVADIGGHDLMAIHFLRRCAQVRTAADDIERILAQIDRAKPERLARLRERLRKSADGLRLAPALRRDRAWMFSLMETADDGPEWKLTAIDGPPSEQRGDDPLTALKRWETRGWYWHSEALMLELMTRTIRAAELPLERQVPEFEQITHDTRMFRATVVGNIWNSLGTLAIPMAIKVAEGYHRTCARLRCAEVALAVEEYRLKNGRWPDSLDALTIEVPIDPFDGKPIKYVKRDVGVSIYSVARDGKDDGGQLAAKPGEWRGVDEVFRLWDSKHRRQAPPEQPPID